MSKGSLRRTENTALFLANWPRCESVSEGAWGQHRCERDMGHRGLHKNGSLYWGDHCGNRR